MAIKPKPAGPRKWQDIVPAKQVIATKKRTPLALRRFWASLRRRSRRATAAITRFLWPRSRKRRILTVVVIGALACVIVTLSLSRAPTDTPVAQPSTGGFTVSQLSRGTPEYNTVLPAGKTIDQLGGWTKVSPAKTDPVFAYVDTLSGITIRVSQQQLPSAFKDDAEDQVKSLAEEFTNAQVINVGDTTVYIDQPKKGAQSVIFTKNQLLISIRASAVIDTGFWANYVSSLQ